MAPLATGPAFGRHIGLPTTRIQRLHMHSLGGLIDHAKRLGQPRNNRQNGHHPQPDDSDNPASHDAVLFPILSLNSAISSQIQVFVP
jgi:hypothetical protein